MLTLVEACTGSLVEILSGDVSLKSLKMIPKCLCGGFAFWCGAEGEILQEICLNP